MARGINKVILVGNLGAEPDVRYSGSGNAVARISLATTESWKDKQSGDLQQRTEWHRVVFFGRRAEIVGEYLHKGSQVYIEGSLRTSSYEKEGQTHYSTDIIANEMQMLGAKTQSNGAGQQRAPSANGRPGREAAAGKPPQSHSGPNMADGPGYDTFDDDIPF